VWPLGTTDFSINNASPLQTFSIGSNQKAESTFIANATGVFPIMFEACYDISDGGPYDFTAYVRHVPRLALLNVGTVTSGRTITVAAHYPDGSPISDSGLGIQVYGRWSHASHLLGSGTPANGQAVVKLTIPRSERGFTISLTASASGANYVPAHTPARTVHVR
jgi:hypothetical protein